MVSTEPFSSVPEQLSALVDGELDAELGAAVVERLPSDAALCGQWHSFQMIGDVLRSQALAPHPRELEFLDRLRPALAREAAALRPAAVSEPAAALATQEARQPANQSQFRWQWLAGVAVVALVLGIFMGHEPVGGDNAAALAVAPVVPAPAPQLAREEASVMIRDPELDALLAAHQQMAGSSALQKPSGFLRNATFQRSR